MKMTATKSMTIGTAATQLFTTSTPCDMLEIYFDNLAEPNGNHNDAAVIVTNSASATSGAVLRKGGGFFQQIARQGDHIDASTLYVKATRAAQVIQVCVYG